jgi:hypothetical protein
MSNTFANEHIFLEFFYDDLECQYLFAPSIQGESLWSLFVGNFDSL